MDIQKILTYWICESGVDISGKHAELLGRYLTEKLQEYQPKIQVTLIQCENCGCKEVEFSDVDKIFNIVNYKVKCKHCGCIGKVREEWDL